MGLRKTFLRRNALNSSDESCSSSCVLVPSNSGRPTDLGVSRNVTMMKITPSTAMAAGTQNVHCHAPTCCNALVT